jgi:hypothetical protein
MKNAYRWKLVLGLGLIAFLAACAPKRRETQFAKNKEAEAGQTYTEDQLRAALGSDRYDALVMGIGAANLNLLTYGIGISNMTQLINGVTSPGKLVSLMSNGPNSRKLTAIEVLDLLNKLDDACQQPGSYGNDTLGKMINMINNVTLAGMEGIKNVVHGVQDQPADLNGYTNGVARLGLLISLLNENLSVMPTLVNDLAAPGGVFSAAGNEKLIRLVNNSLDMRDLAVIINGTTNLSNITAVMAGLTGNMYCSKPEYQTPATCTSGGGVWTNTLCSNPTYTTRAACTGAGATWTPDGIENMGRIINELDRRCSNIAYTNGTACLNNGGVWHTKASKIPVIVNNITVVPNMYQIVNNLTNDGKRPAWPSGLPAPYPGDPGNVFDGVDSMVATLNTINVPAMGDPVSANNIPFGLNGVKRLAYMVNQLDTNPVYGNDSDFENGGSCSNPIYETQAACTGGGGVWTPASGYDCANGLFDNRLNWAISDNGAAGSPWYGKSWRSGTGNVQAGTCSLRSNPAAATASTVTQSAELIFNLTTAGNATFYTKTDLLGPYDTLRIFLDDSLQLSLTQASGGAGFQPRSIAVTTGVHRLRFDVHRAIGSTGNAFLDTMVLPGTKGAARTAAEKTAIMLNFLYIASSITNVADLLNNVTAPPCISTPTTCNPTNNNGVDALIYTVNRAEYPANIATEPRLATTVNGIANLNEMYNVLNNLPNLETYKQLVAMMDFVQTPANIPTLINTLGSGGGTRTAQILSNLTAAGTNSMLRVLADPPTGAPIADVARLINGATTTTHVGTLLTEMSLSGNIFLGKSQNVTISVAPPAVVSWNNHGYKEGDAVQFSTTGQLPAPLVNGQIYYIKNVATNTFNLSSTRYGAAINTTAAGSGTHTAYATGELYYASPVGGAKLATFFNQVNTVSTANSQNCTTGNASQFCIKNHLVRLVNDIAASPGGPQTIAQIVGGMRPDTGPGGLTGVERMTNVLFDLRTMDAGTCTVGGVNQGYVANSAKCTALGGVWTAPTSQYTNALANTTTDPYGRLTTMIGDMGGSGGVNTARMVNEVNNGYMSSRVSYLVLNINRMRYLSRILSELTTVDLMLQLLNDPSTNINTIDTLVDTHGNNTYGFGPIGSPDPSPKYGQNPSGTGCTTQDCDVNGIDQLGRLIQLINNIYAIQNTLTLINNVQDIGYISYLITNVHRIKYLTDIVNNLTNVDLMVKVINGADACSVYVAGVNDTIDTLTTCAAAGGTWFGVGRCITAGQTTQQTRNACLLAGGTWYGAEQTRLKNLLNALGGSTVKGTGSKNVGDMYTLYDVMNRLGYNGLTPRTAGQQVRVVRLVNAVNQCGLKPAYDKYIQYGPTCVDNSGNPRPLNFQFQEACQSAGAGYNWQAKASTTAWVSPSTIYYDCRAIASDGTYNTSYVQPTPTQTNGGYYNNNDSYDARPRLLQAMLNVDNGLAFSFIVGDVQDTQKTIDIMNGVRRIRAITQFVNWVPGAVTARLINDTHPAAINRALVYLANNLDDDENETAKVFAQMVHYGTRIVRQTPYTGSPPTCLEFTGLGPGRLARVLNLEAGPYLEGLLAALGPHMAIAAMNCGFARDSDENVSSCPAGNGMSAGGMLKAVGSSYNGSPKPSGTYCVNHQEITAGYKYGNYSWSGGTQGVNGDNCRAILPNDSGATIFYRRTDRIIWEGWCPFGCVDDGMDDIWEMLKGNGSGILGWVMDSGLSSVGLPGMRGFGGSNATPNGAAPTTLCTSNSNNGDNWQCIRQGLKNGDLSTGSNGYHWGGYCSGAATNTGTGSTVAQRCYNNGGTWKPMKNYQSPSCKMDPSVDPPILAP